MLSHIKSLRDPMVGHQDAHSKDNFKVHRSKTLSLTKSAVAGEHEQPMFKRATTVPLKLKSKKSDLGYADFGMTEQAFMKKASVKKQFSARLSFDDEVKED